MSTNFQCISTKVRIHWSLTYFVLCGQQHSHAEQNSKKKCSLLLEACRLEICEEAAAVLCLYSIAPTRTQQAVSYPDPLYPLRRAASRRDPERVEKRGRRVMRRLCRRWWQCAQANSTRAWSTRRPRAPLVMATRSASLCVAPAPASAAHWERSSRAREGAQWRPANADAGQEW